MVIATATLSLRIVTVTAAEPTGGAVAADDRPFAPAYVPARDHLQILLNGHDGQAFASLAMDPLLQRPNGWAGGRTDFAYRASRPMLGWLAWAGSLGQPGAVQWVLLALSVAGLGTLVFGAALVAEELGREPSYAVFTMFLPGAVNMLFFPGLADGLGTGLALIGFVLWRRSRPSAAILLFTLAVLTRDLMVLVPLSLLAYEVLERRRWRAATPLAIPAAIYLAWLEIVHLRIGAWPSDRGGTLAKPFAGYVRAGEHGWPLGGRIVLLLIVALLVLALLRRPTGPVRWLIAAYGLLMVGLGEQTVWAWDTGLARSTLPMQVVAFMMLVPLRRSRSVGKPAKESAPLLDPR